MTGSRRHNFGVTYRETLIDIAIPLNRRHPMPAEAAAAAATRIWTMRWPPPFPARRTMQQFRITATDTVWPAGHGPAGQAPISAILLLSAGRLAAFWPVTAPPNSPPASPPPARCQNHVMAPDL